MSYLRISINQKKELNDSILVIINWLVKIVYYEPVKIIYNAPRLAEIIIDEVVKEHSLPDSVVFKKGSLFISKFCSLLCFFFNFKHRLFTSFYLQTNG